MYSNFLKKGTHEDPNSYEGILTRVSNEIIETLTGVFGPKGNEMLIKKPGSPQNELYLTRDGKEVFSSLRFDDPRAMELYRTISQGIERQARIGDGTTSAALLMSTIIYDHTMIFDREGSIVALPKILNDHPLGPSIQAALSEFNYNSLSDYNKKKVVGRIIESTKEAIEKSATPISYDDEKFKNLIFTTAGDMWFYDFIKASVPALDEDTVVDVDTNELSSETEIECLEKPVMRIIPQYRRMPNPRVDNDPKKNESLEGAVCLYINGAINISKESLLGLCLLSLIGIKNVVIVGGSVERQTNEALKELKTFISTYLKKSELANIVILKSSEFFALKPDEIVDLNTIFYASGAKNNISQPLDFDHKLYNAVRHIVDPIIMSDIDEDTAKILIGALTNHTIEQYDADEGVVEALCETLRKPHNLEMNNEELFLPVNESKERDAILNHLKESLATNRSVIETIGLRKRLARFSSKAVNIKVGSEYLAHSQNHTEILIDSFKAAINGLKHGVIYENGINLIKKSIMDTDLVNKEEYTAAERYELCIRCIIASICDNMLSLIYDDESEYGSFSKDRENDFGDTKICEPVKLTLTLMDNIRLAFDIILSNGMTSSILTPKEL